MKSVKVSIAMCTFNGEKYLKEQLNSIINQTHKPFEIIVCDDCSTDTTVMILEDYQEKTKDVQFKIMKNSSNQGVTKNFENAILHCTGDLILLCDQDDIWLENKIERIISYFEGSNYFAVFTNANIINDKSDVGPKTLWEEKNFTNKMKQNFIRNNGMEVLLKKDVITGCTMAFKKEWVCRFLPLNQNYVHDAWIGIICELCDGLGIILDPLINYRIHSSQQIGLKKTATTTRSNRYETSIKKTEELLNHMNEKNIPCNLEKLNKLRQKLNFYNERQTPSIKMVINNVLNKNYFMFTSGYKAICIDLLNCIRKI